jgi:hypothetical protein
LKYRSGVTRPFKYQNTGRATVQTPSRGIPVYMLGWFLLSVGGALRSAVVWLLPRWVSVRRWTGRLLAVGGLAVALGLESIADIPSAGPEAVGPFYPGAAAIGFVCLVLAVALPVAYWMVAFGTATGSLLGRRVVALGRALVPGRRRPGSTGRTRRGHGGRGRDRQSRPR